MRSVCDEASVYNCYQGCETRTGPYGPTGITRNRSSMRVFNSQEPAYTRKAVNRANRGQTSRF